MPRRVTRLQRIVSIAEVAAYHQDAETSLRLFFTTDGPGSIVRFAGYPLSRVQAELVDRLNETDLRSALAILTRIEAIFRVDYRERCKRKEPDAVSVAFRRLRKAYGAKDWRIPLDTGIFDTWRTEHLGTSNVIGELKGAFRFRHWLAHGRYFEPKLARKYDYPYLYLLAASVLEQFPLFSEKA